MNLIKSEGLLEILSDVISEGLVVVDNKQTIISANKYSHKLFGYEKVYLIGKPLNILIPMNYHSMHGDYFNRLFGQSEKRQMGKDMTCSVHERMAINFRLKWVSILLKYRVKNILWPL